MDMDIVDDHLMIVTQSKIDFYPINIDPREITKMMNGVTNDHLQDLLGFKRLAGNNYISISYNKVSIVKLLLKNPSLVC